MLPTCVCVVVIVEFLDFSYDLEVTHRVGSTSVVANKPSTKLAESPITHNTKKLTH